ncbi:DNA-binding transcriptional regulator AraC [compost metagenome]
MEKAKLLLETTEMKIYEIADAVGYTEIDWFYKKFKEYTGTSANKYRKQCFITA